MFENFKLFIGFRGYFENVSCSSEYLGNVSLLQIFRFGINIVNYSKSSKINKIFCYNRTREPVEQSYICFKMKG